MKLLINLFILLALLSLGCDNGGGNSFSTPFVGSGDEAPTTTDPDGTGNGPSSSVLFFAPANNTLTVDSGDPDVIISVAATPGGGSIALSNPTVVTNTTFVLGPGPLQFTFTCSQALAGGTASVDVTYTPPAPDFPRTVRYNIIVNFTGVVPGMTLTPPSPATIDFATGDLLISATITIPGGVLSLSAISANGTGATFVLGPGPLDVTFTSGSATTVGTETCTITYTPAPPNLPVVANYTANIVPTYVLSLASPLNVNLGSADTAVAAVANPPGGTVTFTSVVLGGVGGTGFIAGPGDGFTFDTSATTSIGTATCNVVYTAPASTAFISTPYVVNVGESFSTGFTFTPIPTGVTISPGLSVPVAGTITEVRVRMDVTYGFFSDLSVSLTSPPPSSTSISLVASSVSIGTSSTSFIWEFEDTASAAMTSPTSGSFLAAGGSLDSAFSGLSSLGIWTLTVSNFGYYYTTYFGGTSPAVLNEWAIAFNGDTSIF